MRLRRYLRDLERTWLGWTFPPPRLAINEAAWRPDAPDAYCNRCGASAPTVERTLRGCGSCRDAAIGVDGVVRLGRHDGALRDWVLAIKYRGWFEMGGELGRLLGAQTARRLEELRGGAPDAGDAPNAAVVPMPMPWQRRLYRGIDHARVIADAVAASLDAAPVLPILAKDNGHPQVALRASLRTRSSGLVRIRRWGKRLRADGHPLVLVDDVRTSGASLRAAARLLRRLGFSPIVGAVLAVADEPSRRPTAVSGEAGDPS